MIKKNWKNIIIIVLIMIISLSAGAYATYSITAQQVSYTKSRNTNRIKRSIRYGTLYEKGKN